MADTQGATASERPLVPSARELGFGVPSRPGAEDVPPPTAPDGPPSRRRAGRLRAFFAVLSLRRATQGGPMLPLVVLTLLASVGAWDDVGFNLLLPLIKVDMGFDFTFLTTLQALVFGIAIAMAPVAGYAADRVKRVWMVRVGAIIGNGAALATGFAGTAGALVATRVVAGFGPGIERPATYPLVTDYYPPETRVRSFTLLQVAMVLGPAAGLGGVYVLVYRGGLGWRPVVVLFGVASCVVSLLTFALREPVRGEQDRRASGMSGEEAARPDAPVGWAEAWRTLRSVQSLRRLWYATPFLTFAWLGYLSFSYFVLQERLTRGDLGGPGQQLLGGANGIVVFLALPPLAGIVTLAVAAPRAERFMRDRPGKILVYVGGALALQAASIVGLVLSPWIVPAFALILVSGAVSQVIQPAQNALLGAVIPARVRGMGYSSLAPWQLLGLLMLPVAGRIADTSGPSAAALAMVPILLVGAVVTGTAGANVKRDMRAALAASRATDAAAQLRLAGREMALVCRDLDVVYTGTQVLFNVDLDIAAGELVALVGTNGAGKSTLLRAIAGLHPVSNGAVLFEGLDITHRPAHLAAAGGVIFLPGGRAIFPTLTVAENLQAAQWTRDPDGSTDVEPVLELFPALRERLDVPAGNLSGGEQQMLGLAQCFLLRPRLLMIDELSLGLAPAVVERLLEVVREINARGTTVVLVEQSVNVALTIADRAVFMEKGRIVFDGPTAQLLARPDLVRAAFLGGTGRGAFAATRAPRRAADAVRTKALEVHGVSLAYGGVSALTGVTLYADAGEVVGIIGPNGAGKTSLFDVVSGFVTPQAGRIVLAGTDVTGLGPDERARLGLVRSFQFARLFPALTVREAITVALERSRAVGGVFSAAVWAPGVRRSERHLRKRVDYLVDLVGLEAFADKFVDELSTGSRRMVDVACVMAAEPTVLLLDEPSSGLAQGEVEVLAPVVQRLARETQAGVVVIEHDLRLVSDMSERLVAMERGVVIATGTPDDVVADPIVTAAYLTADASVMQRSGSVIASAVAALRGDDR